MSSVRAGMADTPSLNGDAPAKQPPFVQIIKTDTGCQVATNLVDPFLAMALLEMGKLSLIDSMKPKLVQPNGGMANMLRRMNG